MRQNYSERFWNSGTLGDTRHDEEAFWGLIWEMVHGVYVHEIEQYPLDGMANLSQLPGIVVVLKLKVLARKIQDG